MGLEIVILAAGKGTRMKSSKPKVLHEIGGKPLLGHLLDTAKQMNAESIHLVCGFGMDQIKSAIGEQECIKYWCQETQLGTGHAVLQAVPGFKRGNTLLILYGDTPLVTAETLASLIKSVPEKGLSVLTAKVENPFGLGRIIREESGSFSRIAEEKDATDEERTIKEINTGMYAGSCELFAEYLPKITNSNAQGEYYLTDVLMLAKKDGHPVKTFETSCAEESVGINDHIQQAALEKVYRLRTAKRLMAEGTTIIDPERFDPRGDIICGKDVVIEPNCSFMGTVKLGDNVRICQGSVLIDCSVGSGSVVSPYTVIEGAVLAENVTVGPFARIRPGSDLGKNVHVGNFVEIKNSKIGPDTKAGHLTYVGDSEVGERVNFGAGTITCNYDGANKHKTIIGDNVFIGSDTQLVAPVEVGNGATIGAGTTVTKTVGANELVITRVPQRNIKNWQRPKKR